jgi:hypothetical protein
MVDRFGLGDPATQPNSITEFDAPTNSTALTRITPIKGGYGHKHVIKYINVIFEDSPLGSISTYSLVAQSGLAGCERRPTWAVAELSEGPVIVKADGPSFHTLTDVFQMGFNHL